MKQPEIPTAWQSPPCQEDWEAELEDLEDPPPFIFNIGMNDLLLPCDRTSRGRGGPHGAPATPGSPENSEEATDSGRAVSCVLRTVPATALQHLPEFLLGGWIQPAMKYRVCVPPPAALGTPTEPPPLRAGAPSAARRPEAVSNRSRSPAPFPGQNSPRLNPPRSPAVIQRLGGGENTKKHPPHLCQTVSESSRKRKGAGTGERLVAGKWQPRGFEVTLGGGGVGEAPSPRCPPPFAPQQHPSPREGGVVLAGIAFFGYFLLCFFISAAHRGLSFPPRFGSGCPRVGPDPARRGLLGPR
ncbi:uncharacterized protein LOC141936590 isoform X2 [Strix uralensis]|uniref:uncharacterized protein LOC141936590 isoform X2 n=1 Tax=Strix uralensis TaxID=36305 RepID=UPI003DA752C5